jgi:hypothetical protein
MFPMVLGNLLLARIALWVPVLVSAPIIVLGIVLPIAMHNRRQAR